MAYYRVCPYCGCHLDPGEICDCREADKGPVKIYPERRSERARIMPDRKTAGPVAAK